MLEFAVFGATVSQPNVICGLPNQILTRQVGYEFFAGFSLKVVWQCAVSIPPRVGLRVMVTLERQWAVCAVTEQHALVYDKSFWDSRASRDLSKLCSSIVLWRHRMLP